VSECVRLWQPAIVTDRCRCDHCGKTLFAGRDATYCAGKVFCMLQCLENYAEDGFGEPRPEPPKTLSERWGFKRAHKAGPWYNDSFSAPLPVVENHPARQRADLGEPHPPYITAWPAERSRPPDYDPEPIPDAVSVMLCDGNGERATEGGRGYRGGDEPWIYADGDNVPEEWKTPIAEALRVICAIWPGKRLLFRDEDDETAQEAA
jgi:hypothetical protein